MRPNCYATPPRIVANAIKAPTVSGSPISSAHFVVLGYLVRQGLLYLIETAHRAISKPILPPRGLDCARFVRDCGGLRAIARAELFVDAPKMRLDGILGQM